MDWSAPIDAYCERTSDAFWAEPLNAVSNLAFLVAALAAATLVSRDRRRDVGAWLLVALIAIIGVGSFLFHTFATRWAVLADVLPITIFIHVYLFLAMRRFFGLPIWASGLITIGYFALSAGLEAITPPDLLNGSVGYLPALLALVLVGLVLSTTGRRGSSALMLVAAVFLVSLTARTLDDAVCGALPIGLHYAWHALNAVVLFLLVRALMRHGRPHAYGRAHA